MSAFGLEGAPYLFSQTGTFPAPYTFTVPATLEVRTDMASASFDGSGASGSWLPAVSFYSPSGVRLGTFPCQGTPLAMGDSAEVTWFPLGLAASSAAAPGGGIQFDTDNEGGWLEVTANDNIPSPASLYPAGIGLVDQSGGGVALWDGNDGGGVAVLTGAKGAFTFGNGGIALHSVTGGMEFYSVASWTNNSFGGYSLTNAEDGFGIHIEQQSAAFDTLSTIDLNPVGDIVLRVITVGRSVVVNDHNGNPIFRVDENGDLHGKTGKALVFDL